jgi:tetratricopeptide (TPR) repeat protein
MHEEARERIEKAVNIFANFYGDVQSTVYYLQMLGDLLLDMSRPEEALPLCERALHIEETHGKDTLRVMHAAIGVGRCLRGIGKMEDAAMQFERALAIAIARRPPDAKREASICAELREWIAEARGRP